ncbi:MAG: ester cyclase [Rhodospirillaceae bacterium]|nr:ester cyclase [Rhodospirillaceae bacterium]
MTAVAPFLEGTSGPYRGVVDYILGITHEIWESRRVDQIHSYYAADTPIFAIGGLVTGAAAIVQNTWDTLAAFPDRLLLGEAVIWSRIGAGRFYSSHRILSPMTNRGASAFGPATGRAVLVRTIADCVIENGVITREWLVRDNYGLVRQLGFDPMSLASRQAASPIAPEHAAWIEAERRRVGAESRGGHDARTAYNDHEIETFAKSVLHNIWRTGDADGYATHYADYAVLHDSSPVASGRRAIAAHHAELRAGFSMSALTVDHVCSSAGADSTREVAVRWTLDARHVGPIWGASPSGAEVLILGVTHWLIVAGRIAAEWTIFDRLAALTQIQRAHGRPTR